MQFNVRVGLLKDFTGEKFKKLTGYRNDDQFVDLDSDILSTEQIDKLFEKAKADPKAVGSRGLMSKITAYRNVRSDPSGKKIGKLELLSAALRAYIEPSANKWLFFDETDGYALPYFVRQITYHKADPHRGHSAHVDVQMHAVTRGKSEPKNLTFHAHELGKTVTEILHEKGFYLETPAAVEQYLGDVELYKQIAPLTGSQFRCLGVGYPESKYGYDYRDKSMEREGQPATVVMDDIDEDDGSPRKTSSGSMTSNKFWLKSSDEDEDEDDREGEDEAEGSVVTPVHPYVQVFDLQQHGFVLVHVRNLTSYVYDKSAADKLVLSRETKNLITILVNGSAEVLEDIIKGKTGGTIVIATGPPGTGKTLTAEVFAEEIERPLYVVQCSQLGTDEAALEKALSRVLTRASRWKAILLIDEADVYVHERGQDIQQNAIVGVFLRVLEYYRGVLFLTSNRATVIDDAIMSRATAWIRYEYPTAKELKSLWQILSKQYQMEMSETLIDRLVIDFPKVSGRNIKNLLKLARMLVRGDKMGDFKVDEHLFQYVKGFLDLQADRPSP